MREQIASVVRAAWPFAGAVYLAYLATLPPPGRYVGILGLVVVLPLLAGKVAGSLFGVGPWADSRPAGQQTDPQDGERRDDDPRDDDGPDDDRPDNERWDDERSG